MVQFASWRDAYLFLRDYANFSCLNCKYSNHNLDVNEEHTDHEYVTVFCKDAMAMVRMDFQFVCGRWVHQDNGKTVEDIKDCFSWNLPQEVIDIIENESDGKYWSIEDIEGVIKDYESKGTD